MDTVKSFSLYATQKPRFSTYQIKVNSSKCATTIGLPKQTRKLIIGRDGKIEYSK